MTRKKKLKLFLMALGYKDSSSERHDVWRSYVIKHEKYLAIHISLYQIISYDGSIQSIKGGFSHRKK